MLAAYCAILSIALAVPSQPGPRSNAEAKALIRSSYKNARKNPKRAMEDLELFLDRYPKHSDRDFAEERLGDLLLADGQAQDAERHFSAILLGRTSRATADRLKVKIARAQIQAKSYTSAKATLLPLLDGPKKRDALLLLAWIEGMLDLPIEGKAYLDAAETLRGAINLDLLQARVVVNTKRCGLNERYQTLGSCLLQTAPQMPLGKEVLPDWCERSRIIYSKALSKVRNFDAADRKYEFSLFNKRLDQLQCPKSNPAK
jgi:tetratricopeptide (TPR) repeat protein